MVTPGTSSKGSQSIVEWLPLLGSIVQALSGMAEDGPRADGRSPERPPATTRGGEARPDRAAI
jgi:hypothetical protein